MKIGIPAIHKQIYKDDVLSILFNQYSIIGPIWINNQLEWVNGVYKPFKNHDKFLIVIYLIKKTLDFYSRNFIKLNYDDFYSKDTTEIEKFNILEISNNLNIPKESARRKVVELEKSEVIRRNKKKIIIDRSSFISIKPIKSIERVSRFLSVLSNILYEEKILNKKITTESLEKTIKENFSYIWKSYYEVQIPMMLSYKKVFGDLESFHIFGTCIVDQHLDAQKKINNVMQRIPFIESLHIDDKQGVNAMSISDITGIPRATVMRKLKKLVREGYLVINEKKHYRVSGIINKKLSPLQSDILNGLANFSSKVYNLIIYK